MKLTDDTVPKFPVVSNHNSGVTGSIAKMWGWLPELSLTSAVGVFLVALGYNAGRVSSQWAEPLFWFGLLLLFLPIAARLLSKRLERRERLALLIVLGIGLYLVKFLQYPLYFAYYDESIHVRTAQTIAASAHLFQANPLLPISAFYPGLEIVATTLRSLTGLPLFTTGIMLIGVAWLVLILALYLFYERISNSAWVAGIATLLYMANPGFIFTDGMFAYESLALPLSVFILFAVVRRNHVSARHRMGLTLVIWSGLGAVVITHHVTSYIFVAFLLLWTVVFLLLQKVSSLRQSHNQKVQANPGGVALLGVALIAAWLIYTGGMAIDYLAPHLTGALNQLAQILSSEKAPRQFFHNGSSVSPLWERMTAYSSEALILLGLPLGLFHIWRHNRANAAALALAVGALAFPVSLILLLTQIGAELADRLAEFLFVAVAFVLAIGITRFWLSHAPTWRRSVILMSMIAVIFVGQAVIGSGLPWARIPGPYLVSADQRSIEPENITAAEWANLYLGPGHIVASDRINTLLMATYGNEWAETSGSAKIPVSWVFISPQFGPAVVMILRQDKIQFLVVDRRLSTALPQIGTYFNKGENQGQPYTRPIDPAALAKFDTVLHISRIFDSGDIIIYDVEMITNAPLTSSKQNPSCMSTSPTTAPSPYPKVASQYTGTFYNVTTGLTTSITLTNIQQRQGNICGYSSGIPVKGSFKGTITTDGYIQFLLTSDTGRATFSFDGAMLPDGGIAGAYCNPGIGPGKCSNYGLWSVSSTQPG